MFLPIDQWTILISETDKSTDPSQFNKIKIGKNKSFLVIFNFFLDYYEESQKNSRESTLNLVMTDNN